MNLYIARGRAKLARSGAFRVLRVRYETALGVRGSTLGRYCKRHAWVAGLGVLSAFGRLLWTRVGGGGGKGMVVGFGAGVVPSTTSNARGALLWVFGARGDIGAVTPVGHLKRG